MSGVMAWLARAIWICALPATAHAATKAVADGFECVDRGRLQVPQKSSYIERKGYCIQPRTGALRSRECAARPEACRAAFAWRAPASLENSALLAFGSPDYRLCVAAGGKPEWIRFTWKGRDRELARCVSADGAWYASTGQVASWILARPD